MSVLLDIMYMYVYVCVYVYVYVYVCVYVYVHVYVCVYVHVYIGRGIDREIETSR